MIFITGATGFLGAHVCATLLDRGYSVRANRRKNSRMNEFNQIIRWRLGDQADSKLKKLEWVEADIMDYESIRLSMEGVEAVFHLAAIVSFWKKRREELYTINVEGTAHVVNAALSAGVEWFIHASSVAANGRNEKQPEISEENDWVESPLNSHYAKSKHLAEMEVWRGREEGLKASMVNPTVILGEGDPSKGSCRFTKKVLKGMPFYTKGQNGYVDVVDVAEAMALVYEKKIDGQRFVLAGENLSALDLISLGAEISGAKKPAWEIKPWMLQLACQLAYVMSLFNGKEPLVTKETATTAVHRYNYSAQKAKDLLGLNFTPIRRTLERTAERIFLQ